MNYIKSVKELKRQIVVVCFGTPSISGDALGPLIGTLLTTKYKLDAFVYGTLTNPINGKNMSAWISAIIEAHSDAIILAVDASLGTKSNVGKLVFRSDGVCPAAVKGMKDRFGDLGVLGVVGNSQGEPLMELMQVSALKVSKMADKMALVIKTAVDEWKTEV